MATPAVYLDEILSAASSEVADEAVIDSRLRLADRLRNNLEEQLGDLQTDNQTFAKSAAEEARSALHLLRTANTQRVALRERVVRLLENATPLVAILNSYTEKINPLLRKKTHLVRLEREPVLRTELSNALGKLAWPQPLHDNIPSAELEPFRAAFTALLLLQRSTEETLVGLDEAEGAAAESVHAMDVLLAPLLKRFAFHFTEKRDTNRPEKPEWMFMHILSVIRDHKPFVSNVVQPLFDQHWKGRLNAVNEFMFRLVEAAQHKMALDLDMIISLDSNPRATVQLFPHWITETISFEQTLRTAYSYPDNLTGCVHVLYSTERYLLKWHRCDEDRARRQFETVMRSETKFTPVDVEDPTIPAIADSIMAVLYSVTERYIWLPEDYLRLQFFETIQAPILQEFLERIDEIASLESVQVESPADVPLFAAFINTLCVCVRMLREWNQELLFQEMWQCKASRRRHAKTTTTGTGTSPTAEYHSGGLFDDTIKRYRQTLDELINKLVRSVGLCGFVNKFPMETKVFSALLDQQRRNVGYPGELLQISEEEQAESYRHVTPSLCDALAGLRNMVTVLRSCVSIDVRPDVWLGLVSRIEAWLYENVIREARLRLAGAKQLAHDMNMVMLIFKPVSTLADGYFRKLKDACKVLTLPSADLSSLYSSGEKRDLQKLGVMWLTVAEVQELCTRRVDVKFR